MYHPFYILGTLLTIDKNNTGRVNQMAAYTKGHKFLVKNKKSHLLQCSAAVSIIHYWLLGWK